MKVDNILKWLMYWYESHCNRDYRYGNIIDIYTVDNPGWYITINLLGTTLEGVTIDTELHDNSIEEDVLYYFKDGKLTPVPSLIETKQDWYGYKINDNLYKASGDSLKLELLLLKFKELFDGNNSDKKIEHMESNKTLNWLMSWYASHCNGDWEHMYGVTISTLDNPGWRVKIELTDTKLENLSINRQTYETSETDWYTFIIKDQVFDATGDPTKLEILIESFRGIVDQQD
ncbi:MAG: hypothetical protein IPP74_07135 [Alphaproteobacteria bacterium]|nr:hypothetical protein [Alphaproteobacteria bacterium]